MTSSGQRTFSGGIVGPAKWAQTDKAKRAYGLEDCENFLIARDGSLFNRPGSAIDAVAKVVGNVTFTGGLQPADTNTVTIGGVTFEFDSGGGVSGGHTAVTIGGTATITMTNLAAAIVSASLGFQPMPGFPSGTSMNIIAVSTPFVTAWSKSGANITITTPVPSANRLIGFRFGGDDSTILELGDGYVRFHVEGAPVTHAAATAYSATASYAIGDMVSSGGVNYYAIAPSVGTAVTDAGHWYPQATTAGVSIYEVPGPWADEENAMLRVDGYADVRFFAQPGDGDSIDGRRVYRLQRVDKTSGAPIWTLTPLDFIPSIAPPGNIATSSSSSGTTRRYKVSAIKNKTLEQSFAGNGATIVTCAPSNSGGLLRLTGTIPASYANNDDVLVVSVTPAGGNKNEDFEAQLLGKIWNMSSVVTGAAGHFDLDSSDGITAASGYVVGVINLESPVLVGTAGGGLVAETDITLAITGHGLVTGDEIYVLAINAVSGNPHAVLDLALIGKVFRVTKIDADNIYINNTTGVAVSGQTVYVVPTAVTDSGGTADTVTLTWDAVPDAAEYWVFKDVLNNGVFGFIGKAVKPTYADVNPSASAETVPLTSDVPPSYIDPTRLNYPAAVAILQQRLVLAGGTDDPTRTRLSKTGNLLNFSQSSPIEDDDSLDFSMLGYTVESIMHALALNGRLFLFTTGDVWLVAGDSDGVIRPDALNLQPTAALGIGTLAPLRVGTSAIFTDSVQSRVRDIGLSQYGGYIDTDLSEYAPALVQGHTLSGWDIQELPDSIVYMAREDGQALALTFDRRNGVYAWTRMTTVDGDYLGFAVAKEQGGLYLYALVERTINGTALRLIERFYLRALGDDSYTIEDDAHFLDCEYEYEDAADGIVTATVTTGTDYLAGSTLTVTLSAGSHFNSWDADAGGAGNRITIRSGVDSITITIKGYSSATVVTGTATADVPASLQNHAKTDWTHYYHVIGGLALLEGEDLAALADGVDISSSQTTLFTVASGKTTLTGYYTKVRAGLPITAAASTIGIDQGDFPLRPTSYPAVATLVVQSRGWKIGPDADNLKSYTPTNGIAATALEDGWMPHEIATLSKTHGGLTLSQKAPLPVCFAALVADARVGGIAGGKK